MAGTVWNRPRSPHGRALADLTIQQPPPAARSLIESDKPPGAAAAITTHLVSRPLSNITEMASQIAEDRGKENLTPVSASAPDKPKPIGPPTTNAAISLSDANITVPRRNSSQRARNATILAEIDNSLHPDLSPSRTTESTLASPQDSTSPLAAASGRVGTLLIQIHRNRSRALIYGQLFVVGALSHQTWVSGEVLFFDVEIYNSTEKSIKRVELQLDRTTTLHPTTQNASTAMDIPIDSASDILAKWAWKKGEDGWCGIAPHTQAAKIWNPIVPAGQATMNTHRFQVRYSLSIFIPCTFSKTASVQIPITVISPNSLGASRLRHHLQHGLPAYSKDATAEASQSPVRRRDSRCARKSRDRRRTSTSSRHEEHDPQTRRSRDARRRIEPNPNSVFMTANPIPRASDELLNEMLQKLQHTISPRKLAHLSATGGQHRKGLSAPVQSIPVLKPLSVIGAHLRRANSDDVRSKSRPVDPTMLAPPPAPTARASFDDDLLRPQHQRQRSREPRLHNHGCYMIDGVGHGSPATVHSFGNSNSSSDSLDLDRFLRERHSFQIARSTSGNPFFKGSTNKERLRSNQHGYRAAKDRYDDYKTTGIGDYGQYEFKESHDYHQPMYDRPYFNTKSGNRHVGSSHSGWKQARTLF